VVVYRTTMRLNTIRYMANEHFQSPSGFERNLNRAFGFFVGLGLAPSYCYLLQVRGRNTGKIYAMPVNLLEINGKKYLVAPRGRTQWVRNAEAEGAITLKKGKQTERYRLRPVTGAEKLQTLKVYLDRFHGAVQRYFSVPAGSPAEQFESIADNHPAFELVRP
jgi:deazaflavin-dependent oxidoreductase (nitroreductase family)